MKRWEIRRTRMIFSYFEGIEADSAEEAIENFYRGDGEINLDRDEHPEWTVEAVEVK